MPPPQCTHQTTSCAPGLGLRSLPHTYGIATPSAPLTHHLLAPRRRLSRIQTSGSRKPCAGRRGPPPRWPHWRPLHARLEKKDTRCKGPRARRTHRRLAQPSETDATPRFHCKPTLEPALNPALPHTTHSTFNRPPPPPAKIHLAFATPRRTPPPHSEQHHATSGEPSTCGPRPPRACIAIIVRFPPPLPAAR